MTDRTDWGYVLDEARDILATYDTQVTLRQLDDEREQLRPLADRFDEERP